MMKYFKQGFFFWMLLSCFISNAQKTIPNEGHKEEITHKILEDTAAKFYVNSIQISGNKKTKSYIIFREIQIKQGDSIIAGRLFELLEASRSLLYNTNLFSEISLEPLFSDSSRLTINVVVKERWYIYPSPLFRLTDRNFNEWWKTYNADFNRVNYGVKFYHYNVSGRADQLSINLLNGFSRNFSLSYAAPYSNKSLTEGFAFAMGYSENRTYPYKTDSNNKILEYKKPDFSKQYLYINGTYSLRKSYYKRQSFSMQFSYMNIDDSILTSKYNPNYFNENKTSAFIFDIGYNYQFLQLDNVNYPLKGKAYTISIYKRGIGFSGGLNMLGLDVSYNKYIPHPHKFYSSFQFNGKIKLPFQQSYVNQRSLGYGSFYLRGLEYYVIDGVAASLAKYTFRKKLISFKIPVPFHIKALPYLPFGFYAKTYADAGYCYNKIVYDTRLNNILLYTGGFGIDILSIYDLNMSLEYSFNQLKEKGLFLHVRSSF